MPMYKKIMGALGIILLLVSGISFYDYQQSGQAVDLSTLSSDIIRRLPVRGRWLYMLQERWQSQGWYMCLGKDG